MWVWLEVLGDKSSLDVTGHFPILAGFDISGNEIYVARIDSVRGRYTYVSHGANNVSFIDHQGKLKITTRFYVMALKHDPCDLDAQVIPKGAKFQTGPFYWIHGEDHPKAIKKFLTGSDWRSDPEIKNLEPTSPTLKWIVRIRRP